MSFFSRLLTAAAGLGLIWFFWPFGGGGDEVVKIVEPPTGHQGRLFTTPARDESASTKPPSEAAPDKAQPSATIEPQSAKTENGETVAALAPEAAPGQTPKLKAVRFYRVAVRDGGTLETRGNIVIKLDGIDAYAADDTCKDSQGRTWACGTGARAALTRLIRGRAVVCKVPATGKAKSVTTRCTLAGTDLSTWMVAQGWAKPASPAEPQLAKAAEAAQKNKIGVWR
jgi:endonuclease YncB( thermonuclease family)